MAEGLSVFPGRCHLGMLLVKYVGKCFHTVFFFCELSHIITNCSLAFYFRKCALTSLNLRLNLKSKQNLNIW